MLTQDVTIEGFVLRMKNGTYDRIAKKSKIYCVQIRNTDN